MQQQDQQASQQQQSKQQLYYKREGKRPWDWAIEDRPHFYLPEPLYRCSHPNLKVKNSMPRQGGSVVYSPTTPTSASKTSSLVKRQKSASGNQLKNRTTTAASFVITSGGGGGGMTAIPINTQAGILQSQSGNSSQQQSRNQVNNEWHQQTGGTGPLNSVRTVNLINPIADTEYVPPQTRSKDRLATKKKGSVLVSKSMPMAPRSSYQSGQYHTRKNVTAVITTAANSNSEEQFIVGDDTTANSAAVINSNTARKLIALKKHNKMERYAELQNRLMERYRKEEKEGKQIFHGQNSVVTFVEENKESTNKVINNGVNASHPMAVDEGDKFPLNIDINSSSCAATMQPLNMSTNNLTTKEKNAGLFSPIENRQIASTSGLPVLTDISEHQGAIPQHQKHQQQQLLHQDQNQEVTTKQRVPLVFLHSSQTPDQEDENITTVVTSIAPTPLQMAASHQNVREITPPFSNECSDAMALSGEQQQLLSLLNDDEEMVQLMMQKAAAYESNHINEAGIKAPYSASGLSSSKPPNRRRNARQQQIDATKRLMLGTASASLERDDVNYPQRKGVKKGRSRYKKSRINSAVYSPASNDFPQPIRITKLKLLKKEMQRVTPKQPCNYKPTECHDKRRGNLGIDNSFYDFIDKRDIHFLDPGTIKITTRLKNELNKSLKERDETPTNITKINKLINEQMYKHQKKQEKVIEDDKFKVNSNARLINYVKQLQKEGKATLRQHVFTKRVGSQKISESNNFYSNQQCSPSSDKDISSPQLRSKEATPSQPKSNGQNKLRATTSPTTHTNDQNIGAMVTNFQKNLRHTAANSQVSNCSHSVVQKNKAKKVNEDLIIRTIHSSLNEIGAAARNGLISPQAFEVQKLIQPLLRSSQSTKTIEKMPQQQQPNIQFFQNQKLQKRLSGEEDDVNFEDDGPHYSTFYEDGQLNQQEMINRLCSPDQGHLQLAVEQKKNNCTLSCATQGKLVHRTPLTSKFNSNTAPYRSRYNISTSKPKYNAKHFVEKDRDLRRTQRQERMRTHRASKQVEISRNQQLQQQQLHALSINSQAVIEGLQSQPTPMHHEIAASMPAQFVIIDHPNINLVPASVSNDPKMALDTLQTRQQYQYSPLQQMQQVVPEVSIGQKVQNLLPQQQTQPSKLPLQRKSIHTTTAPDQQSVEHFVLQGSAPTSQQRIRPMTAKNAHSKSNVLIDAQNRMMSHGNPSSTYVGNQETTVDRSEGGYQFSSSNAAAKVFAASGNQLLLQQYSPNRSSRQMIPAGVVGAGAVSSAASGESFIALIQQHPGAAGADALEIRTTLGGTVNGSGIILPQSATTAATLYQQKMNQKRRRPVTSHPDQRKTRNGGQTNCNSIPSQAIMNQQPQVIGSQKQLINNWIQDNITSQKSTANLTSEL